MSKLLDEKILSALLSEPSIAAAARTAGCSRDAVYARLRDPKFREKLDSEIVSRHAALRIEGSVTALAAVETLKDVLDSPLNATTRDRLRACEIVLRHFGNIKSDPESSTKSTEF